MILRYAVPGVRLRHPPLEQAYPYDKYFTVSSIIIVCRNSYPVQTFNPELAVV